MTRLLHRSIAVALCLAAPAAPALADGQLGTLAHGHYTCGNPGDASGPAVDAIASLSFTIVAGSSYVSEGGGGTYLLTGDDLVFTRGPLKDKRFARDKDGLWRELDAAGAQGPVRCAPGAYLDVPPASDLKTG